MNQKKAKGYRKLAKLIKPWCKYDEQTFHMVNYGTLQKPDYHKVTNPITLSSTCGRAAYYKLIEMDA